MLLEIPLRYYHELPSPEVNNGPGDRETSPENQGDGWIFRFGPDHDVDGDSDSSRDGPLSDFDDNDDPRSPHGMGPDIDEELGDHNAGDNHDGAGLDNRQLDALITQLDMTILSPPASREIAPVRLAYLQAAMSQIFDGATFLDATNRLQGGLDLIRLCTGSLPISPVPATTIVTAKRRLGLEVDDYIVQRPICTHCYKYYSHDEIRVLDSPKCTVRWCHGIVYREKRVRSGPNGDERTPKRIPAKIHAYSPLPLTIQRFLLRPDFVKNLCDNSRYSEDTVLHDIYDGERWTINAIGLKRVINDNGTVEDVEWEPGSKRLLIH